jgi:3',5'-cyclic AMP phosphodiesterase CpdA
MQTAEDSDIDMSDHSSDEDLANFPRYPPRLDSTTAVVHLEYDHPGTLPECAEPWSRFVCISDTHSRMFPVPDGDVLLHSGDLTNIGTVQDFKTTMEWLYGLPHKHKM